MFVSHTHSVWSSGFERGKPSKRYGQLIKSPATGLSEMLMCHKDEVFKWIEERADVNDESD